jgi:HAE1 family hydrophobic/amphiphilic exporter-1
LPLNPFPQPVLVMLARWRLSAALCGCKWSCYLNIYPMIGLVLLVGLVSKNSILLVDLINRYRAMTAGYCDCHPAGLPAADETQR